MANSFDHAFLKVIDLEGGYVNDPNDPGGETKFGISKKQYPDLTIEKLTVSDAKEIYERDYWLHYGCNGINDESIATKLFEMLVNMRPKHAIKCVQRALMATGHRLKWDGIIGPITHGAINNANPVALLPAMRSEQAGYYERLIMKNPVFEKYRGGWLKRAYS